MTDMSETTDTPRRIPSDAELLGLIDQYGAWQWAAGQEAERTGLITPHLERCKGNSELARLALLAYFAERSDATPAPSVAAPVSELAAEPTAEEKRQAVRVWRGVDHDEWVGGIQSAAHYETLMGRVLSDFLASRRQAAEPTADDGERAVADGIKGSRDRIRSALNSIRSLTGPAEALNDVSLALQCGDWLCSLAASRRQAAEPTDSLLIEDVKVFVESGAIETVHRPLLNRVLNALELAASRRQAVPTREEPNRE